MAEYFKNQITGASFKIDEKNNIFIDGKCANPKKDHCISLEESANSFREGCRNSPELVRHTNIPEVVGHIPNFTYTEYDEKGKPKTITVNTGQPAW